MDTCTEYVNLHTDTLTEVDHLRARTLIDIFSIVWSEIVLVYDEISRMILAERSARPHLNVSCIDWAFKRMSLAQFAVHVLLQGGTYNYFSLFKNKIIPYLQKALIQKKINKVMSQHRQSQK